MARIGFIGLGHMGLPMAINLVKAGHEVTGFDLMPTPMAALTAVGGIKATTLEDTARSKDIVMTMLQTGQQVADLCLGPDGLFAIASRDTLFIDCSSIDLNHARDLHLHAEKNTFSCRMRRFLAVSLVQQPRH